MHREAHLRLELDVVVAKRPLLPSPAPLILPLVRPRVARLVEVRHVVAVPERVVARAHAPVRGMLSAPVVAGALRRPALGAAGGLVVRAAALLRLRAPAATAVEAGRRPAEGAAAAAQARGRPAAGGVGAVVRAVLRGSGTAAVEVQDVAVVGGAAVWVGEDVVGFRDLGEGMGGGGVVAVYVGVVLSGQGVEGPKESMLDTTVA